MGADVKAPARDCRRCGKEIPPQPHGPGRPREFCSRDCRSKYHRLKEQEEIERERAEERERLTQEYQTRIYGVREAKRRAKERARIRERGRRRD